MRRVLVPLDGTPSAESIIPDAIRLAGKGGTLHLIRVLLGKDMRDQSGQAQASRYLEGVASPLRLQEVNVQVKTVASEDVPNAIDTTASAFSSDVIACAMSGGNRLRHLVHGSVAWRVLAHSPVPVLIRNRAAQGSRESDTSAADGRHILVPLDGSTLAEKALPLARDLAAEWGASIWLTQAVSDVFLPASDQTPLGWMAPYPPEGLSTVRDDLMKKAHDYLNDVAKTVSGQVHMEVLEGPPGYSLTGAVEQWSITDVVMTSHGRTGVSELFIGSVAHELVHHLSCPILIVPIRSTTSPPVGPTGAEA